MKHYLNCEEVAFSTISRRSFLLQMAGLAAGAALGSGSVSNVIAKEPLLPGEFYLGAKTQKLRRKQACKLRTEAAKIRFKQDTIPLSTNGDEEIYPTRIGNFGKSLPHDDNGHVDLEAFGKYVDACNQGTAEAFETVPGGPLQLKNPLGGYAFTMEGADPYDVELPPPPSFASAETASEIIECYWHALLRDVPFADYDTNLMVRQAANDLGRLPAFKGPREGGAVTPQTLFRGTAPGCSVGPFLSQLLLKDMQFGHTLIPQKYQTTAAGVDYLTTWDEWLANARGVLTTNTFAPGETRHLITGRDLTHLVHIDFPFQLPQAAALALMAMGAPSNPGDPYKKLTRQCGFASFAAPHMLDALARVSTLALRTAWRHKYTLHRRLRPEEFAARVHRRILNNASYPIHANILGSRALSEVFARWGSYLLPQAFPEGCPAHSAYPSGHATFVGAGITVIKAFIDENWIIPNPVVPSEDGQLLVPYTGAVLTVGGELNKLAANVAIGRNFAGVHWRTDAMEGNFMGERVAIEMLRDLKACYVEKAEISFTSLTGEKVTI